MNREAKVMIGVGLLLAVVFGVIVFLGGSKQNQNASDTPPAERLVRADSQRVGTGDKVTIVEFGDYQCPGCAAVSPILNKVLADFTGQVSLVYRHYPLPIHPNAVPAAKAAEAAARQGKFKEMHDVLFSQQTRWSESGSAADIFEDYARQLGLDVEKYKVDVASQEIASLINRDKADAEALSLPGTPTLFFNGERYNGSLSDEAIRAEITKRLGQ